MTETKPSLSKILEDYFWCLDDKFDVQDFYDYLNSRGFLILTKDNCQYELALETTKTD